MSDKLGEIQSRIASIHDLESVVGAMRGIAAARAHEARTRLDGVRACAAMIGNAIADAMYLVEHDEVFSGTRPVSTRPLWITVCSDQGFVGTFNEHLIDSTLRGASSPGALHFVIGSRGHSMAAERAIPLEWCAPMAAHADDIGALADRIIEAMYSRLEQGRIDRVTIVHAVPSEGTPFDIVTRVLVPFDFQRFSHGRSPGMPPLVNLPPRRLLERLAQEYVFDELCEALMLSFSAENEARMRAMISARAHIQDTLKQLDSTYRQLRQEAITSEIVELSSGTPLRHGAGKHA